MSNMFNVYSAAVGIALVFMVMVVSNPDMTTPWWLRTLVLIAVFSSGVGATHYVFGH